MFDRPNYTYQVNQAGDKRLTKDSANPLIQISKLIHDQAKILDIGAGNGSLGRLFSLLGKNVIVDGIEPNAVAASITESYYRAMYLSHLSDHISVIDF